MNNKLSNFREKLKIFSKWSRDFLYAIWLPVALVILLVLENHLFNLWSNIPVRAYFVRRSVVVASFGTLLFGPAVLLNKQLKYLYLGFVSLFSSLILVLQFLYYSYAGGFLQASAFLYAGEGVTVFATVKTLLTYRLLFFALGPLLVLVTWILSYCQIISEKILNKREKIVAGILVLLLTVFGYSYIFLREHMEAGNTVYLYKYSKIFDINKLVGKIGIVNFSLGDALTLGLDPDKASAADIGLVEAYKEQRQAPTHGKDFGLLKNRNLILIQVESLENAVVGQKIGGQEITPNLNKLAKEGLYFSNYYAPIGPGNTADAEFMTLNSLYSLSDTVAFVRYAYDNYTALPGLLVDNGYHTYSFHGDVPSFWNRANIYPQLGYDKWFGRDDYTIPRKIGVYELGDKEFFEQTIPKLKTLPQPFMATLITLTSHTPFMIPEDLQQMKIPADTKLNWLQQQYVQSVHYTDQAIADFITQLKAAGLYDNSLILIYGDHGSLSGISKALGVKQSVFADLQTSQVPLIILAPGTSLQGEKNTPGNHLDVYPTVANLLGITPPTNVFGHDLIDGQNNVAVSRNLVSGTIISIITNNLAYHSASDGVFENGKCLELPSKKKLATSVCRSLYEKEDKAVKASDLMVKWNLVGNKSTTNLHTQESKQSIN